MCKSAATPKPVCVHVCVCGDISVSGEHKAVKERERENPAGDGEKA